MASAGGRTSPPQVLRLDGGGGRAVCQPGQRIAGDSEAYRARGHLHVQHAHAAGGTGRERAVRERDAHPPVRRGDSRVGSGMLHLLGVRTK